MNHDGDLRCGDCGSWPLRFVCGSSSPGCQRIGHSCFRRADVLLGKTYAERDAAPFPAGGITPLRSLSISNTASLPGSKWKPDHRSLAAPSLYGLWTLVSIASRTRLGSQKSRSRGEEWSRVPTDSGRWGNLEGAASDYRSRNHVIRLAAAGGQGSSVQLGFACMRTP